MRTAQVGDRVRIQYSTLSRGSAATRQRKPKSVEFIVGSRDVLHSLSFGVVGMAPGDRKRLTLQPTEAYGVVRKKLIRRVSRDRLPGHLTLRVGQRLTALRGVAGRRRRVTVVAITHDSVVLDSNHPLAGKVVELELNLMSVDSSANAKRRKTPADMGGKG